MTNPFFTNLKQPQANMRTDFDTGRQPLSQGGNWFQNNQWATQDKTGGVGQIGTAVTSAVPSTQDGRFSIDKNAGFKGSFQGLSQGGVGGAIIGGVLSQLGESGKVRKELDALDTGVQGVSYDAYGRPVYSGEAVSSAYGTINELDKGAESMKLGAGADPASWAFNIGNSRRIKRKRAQLQRNAFAAQQSYNTADASNRALMNNLEGYQERMNPSERLYNLYRSQY